MNKNNSILFSLSMVLVIFLFLNFIMLPNYFRVESPTRVDLDFEYYVLRGDYKKNDILNNSYLSFNEKKIYLLKNQSYLDIKFSVYNTKDKYLKLYFEIREIGFNKNKRGKINLENMEIVINKGKDNIILSDYKEENGYLYINLSNEELDKLYDANIELKIPIENILEYNQNYILNLYGDNIYTVIYDSNYFAVQELKYDTYAPEFNSLYHLGKDHTPFIMHNIKSNLSYTTAIFSLALAISLAIGNFIYVFLYEEGKNKKRR